MKKETQEKNNRIKEYNNIISNHLKNNLSLCSVDVNVRFSYSGGDWWGEEESYITSVYINILSTHLTTLSIKSFVDFKGDKRNWCACNCPKLKNSNSLYFLLFQNRYYALDHETKNINGQDYLIPLLPFSIYDLEKEKVKKIKDKQREEKIKKLEKEFEISSISGKLLLEGVTSEITIKDQILFIHNFGEAFLRVSKSKEIYTLSISRGVNRKEYMKIGEYSEEDLIKHISNLFKIGMLNELEG